MSACWTSPVNLQKLQAGVSSPQFWPINWLKINHHSGISKILLQIFLPHLQIFQTLLPPQYSGNSARKFLPTNFLSGPSCASCNMDWTPLATRTSAGSQKLCWVNLTELWHQIKWHIINLWRKFNMATQFDAKLCI